MEIDNELAIEMYELIVSLNTDSVYGNGKMAIDVFNATQNLIDKIEISVGDV